jgi:hypothetical protein
LSVFKQIVSAGTVEDAVAETIKTWMETYLREVERQAGVVEHLALPRSYNIRPETDSWPEEQLPGLVVVSAGTSAQPIKAGDGVFTAPFRVAAVIFAKGTSKDNVRRNVRLYTAAIRAILLQKRGLGGLSDGIIWESENFHDSIPGAERSLAAGDVTVVYNIPEIVSFSGGPMAPADPVAQPGSEWPEVLHPKPVVIDKL